MAYCRNHDRADQDVYSGSLKIKVETVSYIPSKIRIIRLKNKLMVVDIPPFPMGVIKIILCFFGKEACNCSGTLFFRKKVDELAS